MSGSLSAAARVALLVALAGQLGGCIDPENQRPGLWLRGELASSLPADWSFANHFKEIAIQVPTPYWIPHSVTIWCAVVDRKLYVGARNPERKRWPAWVARDPDVRLRIGGKLYDVRLARVDDAARIEAVRRAYAAKYDLPAQPPEERPPMRYWRVEARG